MHVASCLGRLGLTFALDSVITVVVVDWRNHDALLIAYLVKKLSEPRVPLTVMGDRVGLPMLAKAWSEA